MPLSWDDARSILKLLRESELAELRIEIGDFKLYARQDATGAGSSEPFAPAAPAPQTDVPSQSATPRAPATPSLEVEVQENEFVVRAPMVGVFYRAPSPEAEPFAKEGDVIEAHDTLFIIEVMKLFNSVNAGVSGRVVRFLVENAQLVQHNQPVALIRVGKD